MNSLIILPIISMVSFGILNTISKPFIQKMGSGNYVIYRGIGVVVSDLILLLIMKDTIVFDLNTILFAIFIAAFSYIGFWAFNESIDKGKIGIVVPISSIRVIITTLIGVFILGESLSPLSYIAISIVFLGIALNSINFKDLKNINILDTKSGIPQALVAGLVWGISFAYFGKPSSILGAYLFGFIVESIVLLSALIQSTLTKSEPLKYLHIIKGNPISYALVVLFGVLGSLFMNLSFEHLSSSITSAITSASPFITIIYAYFVFKEKLSKLQYLGSILIIVGVILISV